MLTSGRGEVEGDKSSKSVRNVQKEKAKGEAKATKGKREKEENDEKEKREGKEDKQEEGKEARQGKTEKKEGRNHKKEQTRRVKKEVNESAKGEATVHASHAERCVKAGLTTVDYQQQETAHEQSAVGATGCRHSDKEKAQGNRGAILFDHRQTLPMPSLVGARGMERRLTLAILLQQGSPCCSQMGQVAIWTPHLKSKNGVC